MFEPIFLEISPGNIHTKGLLLLLYMGLEGVTEVNTDPNWRFVPFKVTRCNNKVLCVYSLSGHNTREQLAMGHVFERLKNCMGIKSEGNKNKAILANFICPMDKIDRDHGKKTQRLNICDSNYVLLKLIVDDVLK